MLDTDVLDGCMEFVKQLAISVLLWLPIGNC